MTSAGPPERRETGRALRYLPILVLTLALSGCSDEFIERAEYCQIMTGGEVTLYCAIYGWTGSKWVFGFAVIVGWLGWVSKVKSPAATDPPDHTDAALHAPAADAGHTADPLADGVEQPPDEQTPA